MSGSSTESTVGAAYRNEFGLRKLLLELPAVGDVLAPSPVLSILT